MPEKAAKSRERDASIHLVELRDPDQVAIKESTFSYNAMHVASNGLMSTVGIENTCGFEPRRNSLRHTP